MPGAPGIDRDGTPGFRELASVRLDQNGKMGMARWLHPERAGKRDLPGGGIEQICPANDVRDALPRIVDYHGKLIREEAIAASHDHIAACAPGAAHGALDPIVEHIVAVVDPKARGSGSRAFGARAAGTGISTCSIAVGAVLERLACAAACEQPAGGREHRERVVVGLEPGALTDGRSVPLEAAGLEGCEHARLGARHDSCRIEVFDAQQPALASMACIEIAACRGEQRAQMQIAGGRRREAPAAARGRWIGFLQR